MRARFKVVGKTGTETCTISLEPTEQQPEGSNFFGGLPHGTIALYPVSKEAAEHYELGAEVELDMEPLS